MCVCCVRLYLHRVAWLLNREQNIDRQHRWSEWILYPPNAHKQQTHIDSITPQSITKYSYTVLCVRWCRILNFHSRIEIRRLDDSPQINSDGRGEYHCFAAPNEGECIAFLWEMDTMDATIHFDLNWWHRQRMAQSSWCYARRRLPISAHTHIHAGLLHIVHR